MVIFIKHIYIYQTLALLWWKSSISSDKLWSLLIFWRICSFAHASQRGSGSLQVLQKWVAVICLFSLKQSSQTYPVSLFLLQNENDNKWWHKKVKITFNVFPLYQINQNWRYWFYLIKILLQFNFVLLKSFDWNEICFNENSLENSVIRSLDYNILEGCF